MLRGRCGAEHPIPGVAAFGGQPWVRVDCRDSTSVLQLEGPLLALARGMATDDGLVAIVFPGRIAELAAYARG